MLNSDTGIHGLFGNNHVVMLLVDPAADRIVDANQAAASFYGYSVEQLKKMNLADINVPSSGQLNCHSFVNPADEERHSWQQHRLADGQIREIESFSGPVEINGVRLLYFIIFDVTEHRRHELEFSFNQDRLKSIVKILQSTSNQVQEILENTLNEAIELTRSRIGYILRYDEVKQQFTLNSWSRGVMTECNVADPPRVFELDHTGLWGEAVRQRKPIIVNDFAAPNPFKKGHPAGHVVIGKFMTVPVFSGGKIVAVVGVANKSADYDQTDTLQLTLLFDAIWKAVEKIESQKKVDHLNRVLRGVCEVNRLIARAKEPLQLAGDVCKILSEARGFAGVMVLLTNRDGVAHHVSLSGLLKADPEFHNQIMAGLLPPCCIEALQNHGALRFTDRTGFCRDCLIGQTCEKQISIVSAMRFNGELFGFVSVALPVDQVESDEEAVLLSNLAEDIALALHNLSMRNEKQLAEKDRDSLQSQLIQAQKIEAIGQLAGGVAHDFNNLLSVILGYGEIIMQDVSSDSVFFEPISEIYAAAERARILTRQLLAFSRKQIFEVKLVQINSIVSGFEKFLRRIIGEQIKLDLKLCKEEAMVKADVSQIEQTMMNLAINARDAMPAGGVLTIETARHYFDDDYASEKIGVKAGNYVMLSFSDTGTGIPKEVMEHMFEPFYTTKGSESGTGLGLSTAYGIVRQHEGHIWAYSELGRGSTFKIFLPLTCGIEEPVIKTPEVAGQIANATVLVVEDDLLVRRLACKILARQGYRVLEAEDYNTAVDIARNFAGRIDLLLSDVIMPGKEGPEVFKTISEFCPDIKVLYMSGYSPTQISQICKLDNGEAFVQKPISVSALLGKVSQMMRSKKGS